MPPGEGSDYGSDFDEDGDAEVTALLNGIELRERAAAPYALEPLEESSEHGALSSLELGRARVPTPASSQASRNSLPGSDSTDLVPAGLEHRSASNIARRDSPVVKVEYQPGLPPIPQDNSAGKLQFEPAVLNPDQAAEEKDTRSPLLRFRTPPKKPLSVTDLVSPAWCELQYWYNLTKYGRVRRTPAMKQGSEVHKVLEEQVHETVSVDVKTKEDFWALRMWNVIQGLRTLRVTGTTRELEIWGLVEGEVVNGVIDELSYTCPDQDLQTALDKVESKQTQHKMLEPGQKTLSEFFGGKGFDEAAGGSGGKETAKSQLVYITDVKTRRSNYLPNGVSLRPTFMQLMLYRKMLSGLATDSIDPQVIFRRYNLRSEDRLSDPLLQQLSSLELNLSPDSTQDSYAPVESPVDAVLELLTHNSLTGLWGLMMEEFAKTFPKGASSISKVLQAEFRGSQDGNIIGTKSFAFNENELDAYVRDEMSWWKGERDARGVDVEEAFKCRMCEFAEGCTWRATKIEDAVQKTRAKIAAGRKSMV